MAVTTRHKKAAKNLGKYRTEQQALVKANYSESYARSGQIKYTKGWQEMMDNELPDAMLLTVHKEGLKATKTFKGKESPDYKVRREYLSEAYKTKGRYAAEKHLNMNVEVEALPEIRTLTERLNAIYGSASQSGDGGESCIVGDKAQDKE